MSTVLLGTITGPDYILDDSARSATVQLTDDQGQVSKSTSARTTNTIVGTPRPDRLRGTSAGDSIDGLGGNDTLLGLGGNDVLIGNTGRDALDGGKGRDTLFGGVGSDRLTGGAGRDIFVLERLRGRDTIEDFTGQDRLGLVGGLTFGQLEISQRGSNTLIAANGQALALLKGVNADQINQSSFVNVNLS